MLARCAGLKGFAGATDAMFAQQSTWMPRGYQYLQVNEARLNMYPEAAKMRALADASGLTELVQARGGGRDTSLYGALDPAQHLIELTPPAGSDSIPEDALETCLAQHGPDRRGVQPGHQGLHAHQPARRHRRRSLLLARARQDDFRRMA